MIAALLACGPCAAIVAPQQPRDATGQGLAFVEASVARRTCYLRECVRVHLHFGVEEEFLREKAVQPFGTKLELPVQLSVPWLDGLEGAVVIRIEPDPAAEPDGPAPRFVQNESVRTAIRETDRVVDGRRFLVCGEEVVIAPTAVGSLRIPAPVLSFAYATRFEDSFLEGRAPVDRVDAFVAGESLVLEVRPLPETGRPPEFSGAVGRFTVRAEAEPPVVALGQSLKLRLIVEGEGNLAMFEPPRWSEIGGFRVLGTIDEKSAAARTLTYDLAPVSTQAWQVPALPFAYFDPEPPEAYRVVRTQPIDVIVRAAKRESQSAPESPAPTNAPARLRPGWSRLALLGVAVLLILAGWRRRR